MFFSLNISLETVFRIKGEMGFVYKNIYNTLGFIPTKNLKIDQYWPSKI